MLCCTIRHCSVKAVGHGANVALTMWCTSEGILWKCLPSLVHMSNGVFCQQGKEKTEMRHFCLKCYKTRYTPVEWDRMKIQGTVSIQNEIWICIIWGHDETRQGSIPACTIGSSLLECQASLKHIKNEIHPWKTRPAWILVINFRRRSARKSKRNLSYRRVFPVTFSGGTWSWYANFVSLGCDVLQRLCCRAGIHRRHICDKVWSIKVKSGWPLVKDPLYWNSYIPRQLSLPESRDCRIHLGCLLSIPNSDPHPPLPQIC